MATNDVSTSPLQNSQLTYAEVVWAMPAIQCDKLKPPVTEEGSNHTELDMQFDERCLQYTSRQKRYPKCRWRRRVMAKPWWRTLKRSGRRCERVEPILHKDGVYKGLSKLRPVKVREVEILLKVDKINPLFSTQRSKKPIKLPAVKQRKKQKLVVKKKLTECCGSHYNDLAFLDHFLKMHMEKKEQLSSATETKSHPKSHSKTIRGPTRTGMSNTPLLPPTHTHNNLLQHTSIYKKTPNRSWLEPALKKLLLCCGDVELNPGPVFKCLHQMCQSADSSYSSIRDLAAHISAVHATDWVCLWDGCVFSILKDMQDDREMETHMLKHLYMTNIFPSIEVWAQSLPSGYFDPTSTDLRLCPPALRSGLNLLLLDDIFQIKKRYTVIDHQMYLYHLQKQHPEEYKDKVESFISRQPAGKWEFKGSQYEIIGNQYQAKTTDSKQSEIQLFHDVYCVRQPDNTDTTGVVTSRPELLGKSKSFHFKTIDIANKPKKLKRKHNSQGLDPSETIVCPWKDTVLNNIYKCKSAIQFEIKIFENFEEKSFLSKDNKYLLDAEDCAVRLATSPGSSEGVLVVNGFKVRIDEQWFYYVRFLESGCYTNFMNQIGKDYLLDYLQTSPEVLFLHQVLTPYDLQELSKIKECDRASKGKKGRSDKNYKNSLRNLKQILANVKSCAEMSGVDHAMHFAHCVRKGFHANIEGTTSDEWFLHTSLNDEKRCFWQSKLQSFPLNRLVEPIKTSSDFSNEIIPVEATLLEQSIFLNYLSNSHLLSREKTRYDERFPTSRSLPKSFRNKIIWHFLRNESTELLNVFETCRETVTEQMQSDTDITLPIQHTNQARTQSVSRRKCTASREMVTETLGCTPLENLADMTTIFNSYIRDVILNGTLCFHVNTKDRIILVLNDYNAENGKFRDFDYVHTSRELTEEGYVFRCSCRIYRTLLDCARNEDSVNYDILDTSSSIKCMHCRFLKDHIIPVLHDTSREQTNLSMKVNNGLEFCGKPFIPLEGRSNTRKFSINNEPCDDPSFVHITFNTSSNKYVISCLDGYCKSVRGSKRNIELFDNCDSLCRHLKIIHASDDWQEFRQKQSDELSESLNDDVSLPLDDYDNIPEVEIELSSELLSDNTENHNFFDTSSGLWKFPCRSKHAARSQFSEELASSIRIRDSWNDQNNERINGCLKGPLLVSQTPQTMCPCGNGWTNHQHPEGKTQFSRRLLVYTELAPVLCQIHTRFCVASLCKIEWDEGESMCIHVLSSDTAAGDEIGWMFVNHVLNSKATFSGFCKNMSSTYKRRCPNSKGFMDPGVFLKWWFSWASNVKIEFRKPCPVCKFRPRQLACDGTKVGIGFRNAMFEPIEKTDCSSSNETLHRRLDRCFLASQVDVSADVLKTCREHLFHLGSVASDSNYVGYRDLSDDIIGNRTEVLLGIMPPQTLPSFRRFLADMPEPEKIAYGSILVMLSTTAPLDTIIAYSFIPSLEELLDHVSGLVPNHLGDRFFNASMQNLRFHCPEVRTLIANSMFSHSGENGENILPEDIILLLRYLIERVRSLPIYPAEPASEQVGTYNPPKYGRAYYFSESGCALRNVRQFSIDEGKIKQNTVCDDNPMSFETCNKLFTKAQVSARGSTSLFLWFCPSHGHCYGFHMSYAEGRKDPYASLYTHLEVPPNEIFYDFACNLHEFCLNRESGYYRTVRFFHDIFHGYSHKCSKGYRSSRLLGFDAVNSEICEQFNSFIQCIKSAARQMNQSHFCFYLQFFLHIWNEQKYERYRKRLTVALAGSD